MSMDVRGPKTPQVNALPTKQGPVTQTPAGISGAEALKNAEGMFSKTFEKTGEGSAALILENLATIGTPLVKDDMQVPKVKQEILEVFQELRSQHLREKPSGPTAEAFEHPSLASLVGSFTADDVEQQLAQLLDTPMGELPPQAQRALRMVSDIKFAHKLDNVVVSQQLQSTPEFAFINSSKGQDIAKKASPQILALIGWMNESIKSDKDKTKGGKDPKAPPSKADPVGSKGADGKTSAASSEPVDDAGITEIFDKLQPVFASASRMFGDDMDISSMLIILMGLLAKDAEDDLKEMMKKMQHNLQIKNAKRDMKHAMEDDMKKLNETAQQQLDQLKKDGLVPDDLSLSDYLSYCQVSGPPPVLNEETGDWQTFPPTLTPPSPLPREWEVEKPKLKFTLGLNKNPTAAEVQAFAEEKRGTWKATETRMGSDADSGNTRQGSARYGDNVPKGNGNQMQTDIDRLQDDIDSMGSQSELDQTRMQLYMDRRAKAFETLSNTQKKISESLSAIIKNQT